MNARTEFFDEIALHWETNLEERERIILKEALRFMPPANKPVTVLDAGCGTGVLLPYLSDYSVIAVDASSEMLKIAIERNAHSNVSFIQAACESLPLKDASVDVVVGLNLYPHLTDAQAALAQFRRVMRSHGRLTLLHFQDSHTVTAIHKSIGGAVANDVLPPAEAVAQALEEAGFEPIHTHDDEYFLIVADRDGI